MTNDEIAARLQITDKWLEQAQADPFPRRALIEARKDLAKAIAALHSSPVGAEPPSPGLSEQAREAIKRTIRRLVAEDQDSTADELRALLAPAQSEPAAPMSEPRPTPVARKLHMAFNVAIARLGRGITLPACDGPDCAVCRDPGILAALPASAPEQAMAGEWICAHCGVTLGREHRDGCMLEDRAATHPQETPK